MKTWYMKQTAGREYNLDIDRAKKDWRSGLNFKFIDGPLVCYDDLPWLRVAGIEHLAVLGKNCETMFKINVVSGEII